MLTPEVLHQIDALAERALDEAEAQGMVLGISTRDDERIIRSYGFRNRDAQLPVDEATLFEIGSISKHFLAVVFMQLAAEGRIDLLAPVTDYLPWFSVRSEHASIGLSLIEGAEHIPLQRYSRRSRDYLTAAHPNWEDN